MTNHDVQKYVAELMKKHTEKTSIDAEYVLTRLHEMDNADPGDIIDKDTGAFLKVHDWPLVWRRMLSAMDVKEIMEYQGQDKGMVKVGDMVKFKFPDRLKIIEVLGKHVGVQAFLNKVEVSENSDVAERLRIIREKARGKNGGTG